MADHLFGGSGAWLSSLSPVLVELFIRSASLCNALWGLGHFPLLIRSPPQNLLALGISCHLVRPTLWLLSLGYQPWDPRSQGHFSQL